MDTEEFYRDILDGLGRYLEHALLADLLHTIKRCDAPALGNAWNKNQVEGKRWLLSELYRTLGGEFNTVYVLGGWYGVLSAMLLHDQRFAATGQVFSFDLDPDCQRVAEHLNRHHVDRKRFAAVTRDMNQLNYDNDEINVAGERRSLCPGLVINTSCEHIRDFDLWFRAIPEGMPLVLQSNDYYSLDEHVNCVPDVETFIQQAPMSRLMFNGVLQMKRYRRFMLIGYK